MSRLLTAVVVATLVLLGGASSARSQSRPHTARLWVSINGWGSVERRTVFLKHLTVRCFSESCSATKSLIHRSPAVLVERPYEGWKFTGWQGACVSKKPQCVINVARRRNIHVGANFIPVAAGLTRAHPIPIGTTAKVGSEFEVRVNFVEPSAEAFPVPPAGQQYFAANVTVTYTGPGYAFAGNVNGGWNAIANDDQLTAPCPYPGGPQPSMNFFAPIYSEQSETAWVCWTIASSEAASLELYFGSLIPYNGTIWFAL
jgi:hypothetical protein